ncbi:MAG: two-component regulator propeller domain-containing protein [Candidatus Kapaibacterium sp.]
MIDHHHNHCFHAKICRSIPLRAFASPYLYPKIVALLFVLTTATLFANPSRYRIELISTNEGLPHSIVYTLLPDSRGFLWAGTRDGLVKYDGYSFTTYWNGIPPIKALAEDVDGSIWVGTARGVHRFNRITGTFTPFIHNQSDETSLSDNFVQTLLVDRRGSLWIGTANGLNEFLPESNSFRHYLALPEDSGQACVVTAITEDEMGTLWIGIQKIDLPHGRTYAIPQLFRKERGDTSFKEVPIPDDIQKKSGRIYSIHSDHEKHLQCIAYIPRVNRGKILSIDKLTGRPLSVISLPFPSAIQSGPFSFNGDNDYWVSLYQLDFLVSGLYRLESLQGDSLTQEPFTKDRLVLRGQINDLKRDQAGIFWACTDDGIYKIMPQRYFFPPALTFTTPTDRSRLMSRVRAIYRDREGSLWVSTDHQLLKVDEERNVVRDYSASTSRFGLLSTGIVGAIFGNGEDVLFGLRNGLIRYNLATKRFFFVEDSLTHNAFWSFARDRSGRIWVGTINSFITIYDRNYHLIEQLRYENEETYLSRAVWALLNDRDGRMWAGTQFGLYRWDSVGATPKFYQHEPSDPHSLPAGAVWGILEDRKGRIWLGVYGGGLARYHPEDDSFTTISTNEGLRSNGICALLEDNSGHIWVSTSAGLARYNPDSDTIYTYTIADGLPVNEFALKAAWRDESGKHYFGGSNVIVSFYPDSLARNNHVPPIVVTSFRASDSLIATELQDGDSVVLQSDLNHLDIEFSALDFLNPASNVYEYKLARVDADWVYAGRRRFARYADLDPGTYQLSIRGANSHGVWNEKGIVIYITIVPPFWKTLWFQVLLLCGLLFGVYQLIRLRERRYRERHARHVLEAELQALRLQMKPHFIFNTLHSIQSFILDHQTDEAHAYLTKFARLMRLALTQSEQSHISLQDEKEFLTHYVELEALRTGNTFTFDIVFPEEDLMQSVEIPPILVQPYVENAIHHGLGNKVGGRLVVRYDIVEGNYLCCTIEDSGVGREAALRMKEGSLHKSMGMGVTQKRIDLLNSIHHYQAVITITDLYDEYKAPEGTRVQIKLPIQVKAYASSYNFHFDNDRRR